MKIAYCSDIHLEFGDIELFNDEQADVLILAGDICVAKDLLEFIPDSGRIQTCRMTTKSNLIHMFFQRCATRFPHVLYVVGNHEHYHGDLSTTVYHLKEHLSYLENLHILDKECIKFNDITFIGSTLWTDMNKEDPVTLHAIKDMMADFRVIRNKNKLAVDLVNRDNLTAPLLKPIDTVEEHRRSLDYIRQIVAERHNEKFVVVGHHSPSFMSVAKKYYDSGLMNGAYHSDLSEFILDRPQIKLWIMGHTHEPFDYMIGDTRILCNPRGYCGHEMRAVEFELKYIEV